MSRAHDALAKRDSEYRRALAQSVRVITDAPPIFTGAEEERGVRPFNLTRLLVRHPNLREISGRYITKMDTSMSWVVNVHN